MTSGSDSYPISEIFTAFQGEGRWVGQRQTFVRLAGCTVGKPYPKEMYARHVGSESTQRHLVMESALPIYTEQCTLYDGKRKFACDTDYRVKERMTSVQILEEVPHNVKDVCITGGEPLMHNKLGNLLSYLWGSGKKVHIETSGTIDRHIEKDIWVTVSPKFNVYLSMLQRADEIKILVDKNFDPLQSIPSLRNGMVYAVFLEELAAKKPVYLNPINGEHTINSDNMKLCKEIQDKYPYFMVGSQLHKSVGESIRELVR